MRAVGPASSQGWSQSRQVDRLLAFCPLGASEEDPREGEEDKGNRGRGGGGRARV